MAATKPLVLLTGPNGFVGAHVATALLASNYRVLGVVRAAAKAHVLSQMHAAAVAAGDLRFSVVPDIQAPGALDGVVRDVQYVCHVASPYFTSAADPVKELVEPAVLATRGVMESVLRAGKGVRRVTVLSSFAAVVDLGKGKREGYVYRDDEWDPVTLEEAARDGVLGYHASKTFAEREAWRIWKEGKDEGEVEWDLVTFCPPMIYGPPVHLGEAEIGRGVEGLNTSLKRLVMGLKGEDPAWKPKVANPGLPAWVDVRDVAGAHVKALELKTGVSERFLLFSGVDYYEDGLTGLRAKREAGLGDQGAKVDRGKHFSLDASKAEKTLELQFTPFQKTVEDTWEALKRLDVI